MNLKNVGRFVLFVFILCFVILCQSQTTPALEMRWDIGDIKEWVIPDSIKTAYPTHSEKKDWKDLQRDLLFAINKLDSDMEHYSNKPFQVTKALANQKVWLQKVDGKVVSGIGPLNNYLAKELKKERIRIKSISKIEWFHFKEDDVDIFATVSFEYEILSTDRGGDNQTLDPPGEGEYGHRKICTWY